MSKHIHKIKVAQLVCVTVIFGVFSNDKTAAASLEEKLCVLSAAQKLPVIPTMVISSYNIKSEDNGEISRDIVNSFSSNQAAARALDPVFSFVDAALDEKIKYEYSAGGPDVVRGIISNYVQLKMKSGYLVEINIKAAGLDATYSYACAIGLGVSYVAPRGLMR